MKYLIFFTALIATANAWTCQCTIPPCKEATCPDADKCYSSLSEITTGKDEPLKITIKGCQNKTVEPTICTRGFIVMSSEKNFTLINNVACCSDKDSCNAELVAPLKKDSSDSTLVCPSCFAFAKTCEAKTMKCNSLQKKCFNITGTLQKGSDPVQEFIAKGCAVDNKYFIKDSTLTSGETLYTLKTVDLQDAKSGASQISSCLSFAILLPSVLWFLLDRSVY